MSRRELEPVALGKKVVGSIRTLMEGADPEQQKILAQTIRELAKLEEVDLPEVKTRHGRRYRYAAGKAPND